MSRPPRRGVPDLAAVGLSGAVPDDNRQRLLFAFADAIREKGLHGAQITDVVAHAGASRTTFYRCFADKDAAVVALAELVFSLSVDHVAAAVDSEAPRGTRIDQGIDAFLEFVAADPILVTAIRTELPVIGPVGIQTHLNSADQFATLMATLLREPRMSKTAVGELEQMSVMLVAGLDGAFARAMANDESILALAPTAKKLFRRAVLGDAARPTQRARGSARGR